MNRPSLPFSPHPHPSIYRPHRNRRRGRRSRRRRRWWWWWRVERGPERVGPDSGLWWWGEQQQVCVCIYGWGFITRSRPLN